MFAMINASLDHVRNDPRESQDHIFMINTCEDHVRNDPFLFAINEANQDHVRNDPTRKLFAIVQ